MLPAHARLRRRDEFSRVIRFGRRAGRAALVVHVLTTEPSKSSSVKTSPKTGLVVSRAVGNAVIRHQVSRRLRHLMQNRLPVLPTTANIVIRALPAAAHATSSQLALDLDAALRRILVEYQGEPSRS